jgi:predicted enzyme related to lactoylglutathione lyase
MMAAPRFLFVTIDAADPDRLAAFWSALLETSVGSTMDDGRFVFLRGNDRVPTLCFHRVPEPKSVKNRVHLDLEVDDLDAATARIQELGGSWSGAEHTLDAVVWRTVADPEGNEFDITVE